MWRQLIKKAMLYKKYHRNYVRKFKKGTELIIFGEVKVNVLVEPIVCGCINSYIHRNCHWIEVVVGESWLITRRLVLIDETGREPRIR